MSRSDLLAALFHELRGLEAEVILAGERALSPFCRAALVRVSMLRRRLELSQDDGAMVEVDPDELYSDRWQQARHERAEADGNR